MEKGLLWLPLLGVFIWLAWAGWQEYQKVEAYRIWAQDFTKSKYDIYAVLGQNGSNLTWGKPTPKGPINLKTFSLQEVRSLRLLVNDKPVNLETPPNQGKSICLEFVFFNTDRTLRVPFTEVSLATQWAIYLQEQLKIYQQNI